MLNIFKTNAIKLREAADSFNIKHRNSGYSAKYSDTPIIMGDSPIVYINYANDMKFAVDSVDELNGVSYMVRYISRLDTINNMHTDFDILQKIDSQAADAFSHLISLSARTLSTPLALAFDWAETEEGWFYWAEIQTHIAEYRQNNDI